MTEIENYLRSLFAQKGIPVTEAHERLFREFASDENNSNNVNSIKLLQEKMTQDWQLKTRHEDIRFMQLALPNANAGKPYHADFNLEKLGLPDVIWFELTGFADSGIVFNADSQTLEGTPETSGSLYLSFAYKLDIDPENADATVKKVTIIINADPKSLWKNIPSDQSAPFQKADNVAETSEFLGQTLVAVSKRGRSHANKGSFRDDDYAFADLGDGWGILAVSDGAGSAVYSRKGAALACKSVIGYFESEFTDDQRGLLEKAIDIAATDASAEQKVRDISYPHLSSAAKKAHDAIVDFSSESENSLNDFHATLSFVLIRKSDSGTAFFSFGVGDCPMLIVDKKIQQITSLNTLDVGQYGGGTRFITMPEIFASEQFESRLNFAITTEFPYLVLMTDGIYDPKFEVEANLIKPEKWQAFFDDLGGKNADGALVGLSAQNTEIANQLSTWTDFWSPGNHDDRTLLLIF